MSKKDKLLEKMRRSMSGWKFRDLENLYVGFGFEKYEGGKHTMFIHPKFPKLRGTVTRHRTLPIGYVRYAVKLIDTLKALQEERDVR